MNSHLILQCLAPSRGALLPDADEDEVTLVFYTFHDPTLDDPTLQYHSGIIATKRAVTDPRRIRDFPLEVVDDELDLLNRVVDLVIELDPDIIAGWEIQKASWGYLKARGRHFGSPIA